VLACVEWGYYTDDKGVVSFYPTVPTAHVTLSACNATMEGATVAGHDLVVRGSVETCR
jgi:hypothetical protein